MKLAAFSHAGVTSYGLAEGEDLYDSGAVLHDRYADLQALVVAGDFAAVQRSKASAERLRIADLQLLPPIATPGKILCIGHNYDTHRREMQRDPSLFPAIFFRFADTQLGHGQPVVIPYASTAIDYEGELAVVIGKGGRYIPRKDALAHVAGYACYNDVSVRDWQKHTSQFGPGKNFPSTGPFGPWLVTADEIPDPQNLELTTRLNGQVMQQTSTGLMIFPIDELIAYLSSFTPLSPGDVIVSGTPGGVGVRREPPIFMKAGDIAEVEISSIGVLRNTMVNETA
jgi:2-keto-4-pentenoate hydratase/2-oxohepta-3-ene-1,7-dioic acid hydratase in catechol pathway